MPPAFRLLYHTALLSLAVAWAFIWLRTPSLNHYSLQLFAVAIISYFVIKRFNKADFWQLLPSPVSLEMALATLAFLLIIGATGNIHSPLFPLSFVHLFFLAISANSITAVIVMLEILLFHYSLTPDVGVIELSYLSSLPIVMTFFLVAKDQFYRVFRQQAVIAQKTATIQKMQRVDLALEHFLSQLLESRLPKPVEVRTAISSTTVTSLSPTVATLPKTVSTSDSEPVIDIELESEDSDQVDQIVQTVTNLTQTTITPLPSQTPEPGADTATQATQFNAFNQS